MTETFAKEYQRNHEAMKKWNERRAKAEEEGLKKFRALSELWRQQRENNKSK
jgi:hypothetical protein